jgi:hypothetical protein
MVEDTAEDMVIDESFSVGQLFSSFSLMSMSRGVSPCYINSSNKSGDCDRNKRSTIQHLHEVNKCGGSQKSVTKKSSRNALFHEGWHYKINHSITMMFKPVT